MKKTFVIEVDFTPEEMQATADAFGVSIEQLTDEQLRTAFENALSEEFEGITLLLAELDNTVTP